MYSRLPPQTQRKEPELDIFPDTPEAFLKPGLSNYIDEFFSAIKVFGYLERPVFHELTRSMQTRKLIAGETLLLEREQGFCLVVDGMVQIFVKSARDEFESRSADVVYGIDDDDDDTHKKRSQGYQLLTEVRNGAPMSSLFSILALFTEDVKLRHDDEYDSGGDTTTPVDGTGGATPNNGEDCTPPSTGVDNSTRVEEEARRRRETIAVSPTGRESVSATSTPRWEARSRHSRQPSTGTISKDARGTLPPLPPIPPLSLEASYLQQQQHSKAKTSRPTQRARKKALESAHPDVLARATVDTTIAIIPATAFRRLTQIYPKATAHIVQVILTRLQRVTLSTGHAYLGLTREVLRTEKLMNQYTTYDLPDFLRGSALERLKEKFAKVRRLSIEQREFRYMHTRLGVVKQSRMIDSTKTIAGITFLHCF